jgi:hypothetical protein
MELLYLLQNDCGSKKGYLVEINSASENTFFKETIGDACKQKNI